MKKLVLFDIDETLISSDGAGRRAIGKALANIFDCDLSKIKVSMSGKTDPQILTEILSAGSISKEEIEDRMDEILEIYISLLQEQINASNHYKIHVGIPEILEILNGDSNTCLGLLTGNIETGARMKLNRFDLNRYFPIGAYGSDSGNRMDLPEIATNRGIEFYEMEFSADQVVIIGDSIYDVRCAKGFGAKSIAVNTGVTKKQMLEDENPDHLFEDLSHTKKVLEAILS